MPSPSPYSDLVHTPSASCTSMSPRRRRRLSTTSSASERMSSSVGGRSTAVSVALLLFLLITKPLPGLFFAEVLLLRLLLTVAPLPALSLLPSTLPSTLPSVLVRPRSARPASSSAAAVRSSKSRASTHDPLLFEASPMRSRVDRSESAACPIKTDSSSLLTTTPFSKAAMWRESWSDLEESDEATDSTSSPSLLSLILAKSTA
mmetsp:Transcript_46946/g.142181  ORF Transcript_46946/g.142181 Transcript_46946/m.142181 type:complete len:204 (+) Transcript_46946:743-1354(+)